MTARARPHTQDRRPRHFGAPPGPERRDAVTADPSGRALGWPVGIGTVVVRPCRGRWDVIAYRRGRVPLRIAAGLPLPDAENIAARLARSLAEDLMGGWS